MGLSYKPDEYRVALINEMNAQGIIRSKERAMILAQADHESIGFTDMEENFNYRADRLMAISKTAREAGLKVVQQALAAGAPAVANMMYNGRMGNKAPNDGWTYRGRGPFQITGKYNYDRISKAIGIDLLANPDKLFEPIVAAKAVIAFWKANVAEVGSSGDVKIVTLRINGGTIGLPDRQAKYAAYLLKTPAAPAANDADASKLAA